jgi:nicotinamide-nucleotide amidase
MLKATIITIGDELLIGQVIDTNSAYIAQQLQTLGIGVYSRIAIGDDKAAIINALDDAQKNAKIIIITGGLGPTADDITKPLLCEYFGGKMVQNKEVLAHVEGIFKRYNRPMLPSNIKQADVPDCCTVLFNKLGTAPGMMFEKGGCFFFSLPGVPYEMKGLMKDEVLPHISKVFPQQVLIHQTIITAGEGESFVAERLKEVEALLPAHIKLAYLPNYNMVRLRLTGSCTIEEKENLEKEILEYKAQIIAQLKNIVIADTDETIASIVSKLLLKHNLMLGTAESCTGGHIAHTITLQAGSSAYFEGAVIAYSNDIKMQQLGVALKTIIDFGAVSDACVQQMATGMVNHTKSDISIAVSGIMGPGGGSEEKPTGTVFIAIANKNNVVVEKCFFRFDRLKNIELTTAKSLLMLRAFILKYYEANPESS